MSLMDIGNRLFLTINNHFNNIEMVPEDKGDVHVITKVSLSDTQFLFTMS